MRWGRIAVVIGGTLASAVAQELATVSRAEVSLEVKDGQTQFQLGDVIRLELAFRDPTFPDQRAELPQGSVSSELPGQVIVNSSEYGDLADEVTIAPASGWFQWHGASRHDYGRKMPLDARVVRVPLVLNQGYVFREPGHYEISVTTSRMGYKTVTTNAVGIDIAARPAEDEAVLVKTLDATISSTTGGERARAAEQLAYLTRDDAARAKVRWLLGPDEEVARAMTNGLAATKNQALQIELLKAAWLDPEHAPDGTLQWALRRTEGFAAGQMEPGWVMLQQPRDDKASRALESEYSADLAGLIATLPQRTGLVRRDTAFFLMENNQLSADQLARVKPLVLEEFPQMEPLAQSMLLESRWNVLKDAALEPYLKAIIQSKEKNTDAAIALERLIEIDAHGARPYVVDMVCRSERGLSLDRLKGVKEDRLPEVDDCLAALVAKGERREHDFDWEQATQRAARFATPAILTRAKAGWTNTSQDASMLALLMRDAPKEAVALLDKKPDIEWYAANKVYEVLGGKFPAEVLTWLRRPSAPQDAFYELSHFGEPQDRTLLEQRLEKLREQWRGREAEMKDSARSEEEELVGSLLWAKAWTVTEDEKRRITSGCVSDGCRRYAPH